MGEQKAIEKTISLQKSLNGKESELNTLKEQIQSKERELNSSQGHETILKMENKRLESSRDERQREIEKLRKNEKRLEGELSAKEEALNVSLVHQVTLQKQQVESERELSNKEERISDLENRLNTYIFDYNNIVAKGQKFVNSYIEKVENEAKHNYSKSLSYKNQELDKSSIEIKRLKRKVKDLKNDREENREKFNKEAEKTLYEKGELALENKSLKSELLMLKGCISNTTVKNDKNLEEYYLSLAFFIKEHLKLPEESRPKTALEALELISKNFTSSQLYDF